MEEKFYYLVGNNFYTIDYSEEFPRYVQPSCGINIDYCYRVPENCILLVKQKDGSVTRLELEKDDILFVMYSNTEDYSERKYVVISNDEFKEYFSVLDKTNEKRMSKVTLKGEPCCDGCTDCCCPCESC